MNVSWAAQAAGQLGGAVLNSQAQRDAARKNAQTQREFAQHGVQWKVNDAKAAGVHPLYALGANTVGFQPSYVGDTSFGDALSNMGQDISRAAMSTQTQQEKEIQGLTIASAKLDVEGKALDNQIRASQLKKLNMTAPAMPGPTFIDGQGNSGTGLIQNKPLSRTSSLRGAPYTEPGAINDVGWVNTASGGLMPVPSNDMKERMEDNMFHEATHFFRNNIMPNFSSGPTPPRSALPKGAHSWEWSILRQQYEPVYGELYPAARSAYDRYYRKGGK